MASILNPYIQFQDNARQALEFYQETFGGELTVSTLGEFGDPSQPGADGVMHGNLKTPSGFTIMAADTPPGMDYDPGSNIAISLSGDDGDELRGYWDKLSGDGTVRVPLEKQMWGDEFGMCTDQFGIGWMVNIAGTPA
ncbi:PhnB protein [Phycicoccus badiiscoriae]|uniref:PhnB protein n=1 Tax=Pedococcus badiiscoriae TaxID=642776 RepID=A0A852WCG5_9MICO|nr:VOC family protein [Pedococcus badiiscoriae]NYG06977.1 PhnB protein [Pedococcus badiiscoriae]